MKYQEAIKRIKIHNEYHGQKEPFSIYITEALNMAVEALEKQIPQRAIPQTVKTDCISIGRANWRKGTTVYECPNCGTFISPMYDFCYKCGQALDWSDTE